MDDVKLSIVIPYFNPLLTPKSHKNLEMCLSSLAWAKRKIHEIVIVECAEDPVDVEFSSYIDSRLILVSPDYKTKFLWQKERLINIGLNHAFSNGADVVVWLDADASWNSADEVIKWVEAIKEKSMESHLFQCFETAIQLFDGGVVKKNQSCVKMIPKLKKPFQGTPGGAWAVHRDFYDQATMETNLFLFDLSIVGGGDSLFAASLFTEYYDVSVRRSIKARFNDAPDLPREYFEWWEGMAHTVDMSNYPVSYLEGHTLTFLPHGKYENRKYIERKKVYEKFDLLRDLEFKELHRPLSWKKESSEEVVNEFRNYFESRKENEAESDLSLLRNKPSKHSHTK